MRDIKIIQTIIEKAAIWVPGTTDTFVAKVSNIDGGRCEQLSPEELAMIDPRLPFYLHDVFGRIEEMRLPVEVVGSTVLETLANWRAPYLTIDATDGYTHTVKTVHSINWDRTMNLVVWYFDCLSMLPFEWDNPGGKHNDQYVTGGYHHIADTDAAWMDSHFSGWRARFGVAESLDLGDADSASFILSKPAAQSGVSLSELTLW